MRTKHQAAETGANSDLNRAHWYNRYGHIQHSNTEMRFMKRRAHKANRQNARNELRKNYFNQEVYTTW